jgi:hypothetical protein
LKVSKYKEIIHFLNCWLQLAICDRNVVGRPVSTQIHSAVTHYFTTSIENRYSEALNDLLYTGIKKSDIQTLSNCTACQIKSLLKLEWSE